MCEPELTERLTEFLRNYYRNEVGQLAQRYPGEQRSLYVDWEDVFRFDPAIADDILDHPDEMRQHFEEALVRYDPPVPVDLSGAHVRVHNLDESNDVAEVSRKENLGNLLDVHGQVAKISQVKPRVVEAAFECQRCGTVSHVAQHGEKLRHPHQCAGCERQGPFSLDPAESDWIDHQYARLQQPPERTSGGNSQEIDVHLRDDLIGEFKAGDRVTITGVLDIEQPEKDQTTTFDTLLGGRAVDREESDYEDIEIGEHLDTIRAMANGERGDPFELLVDSINPKHKGDKKVKLAIALQLFGGWAHEHPDGSRDRGDSHILLLGDPGCGKSTFLRTVDELAPRSTYASGKGATAAGMTAAAVPDDFGDTEWSLEAGALVLADGGIACVDEIDKMQSDAVSSMHDALESQQVHINKAGINATLNARTALLAAGNPKEGRFNSYQPRAQQIDLSPTLLSRFDLMFMVSDNPDEERDREVVDHMIRSRRAAAKHTLGEALTDEERGSIEPAIDPEVLRAYIAHAKQTCFPVLRDETVESKLRAYFVALRNANQKKDEDNPVPVTYRQEQAIERLAEASARVRLSDTVELQDVERAVSLVETSMRQVGIDPETGEFDVDVVETDQSKSQRDRRKMILAFLEERDGASYEELADITDIDDGVLRKELEQLRNKGRIYDTGTDGLHVA